ncbi:MAG: hypothetical protein NXY57DRAFT_965567 [Lentinula lateritia]|nr:MAG: hypothetical protein NXY57DRAFT_965567 [Lentinula lateritia]
MHFPKCPDIPTQTPFAPTRIQDPPNRQTPLSSNLDYLPPSVEPPHVSRCSLVHFPYLFKSSPCPFVPATYTEFSLLSISLPLFLSTPVYRLCDHLYDPIHAFTSRLSNPKLPSYSISFRTSIEVTSKLPITSNHFPGTSPSGRVPSQEPTTSRPNPIYDLFDSYTDVLASTTPTTRYYKVPSIYLTSLRLRDLSGPPGNPLKGHHLFAPATTRSFLSSVAVPVAPFELQPAPSTLQHKPSYTKPYLKTYFDPGLTRRFFSFDHPIPISSSSTSDHPPAVPALDFIMVSWEHLIANYICDMIDTPGPHYLFPTSTELPDAGGGPSPLEGFVLAEGNGENVPRGVAEVERGMDVAVHLNITTPAEEGDRDLPVGGSETPTMARTPLFLPASRSPLSPILFPSVPVVPNIIDLTTVDDDGKDLYESHEEFEARVQGDVAVKNKRSSPAL